VHNTEKTWKFDVKNDVALYLSHPRGTVNGGTAYYPFIDKIAEQADITQANIPEDVYKQYFSECYEIKEQSTTKRLSELFKNLESKVGDENTVHFSARLMDEEKIPSKIRNQVTNKNFCSSSVPEEVVEIMKYLPQELRECFEQLWKNQRNKHVKSPSTTDRMTHSMTSKASIKALAAKSLRLKVRDVLHLEHSIKWIEAVNLEVNSLVNNFKFLVPEEIDYEKDYYHIHATIDLKMKYIDETTDMCNRHRQKQQEEKFEDIVHFARAKLVGTAVPVMFIAVLR